MAIHGTRGDIEPCAAVSLELLRRGHDVRMAVPPNLVGFVASAGLAAIPYGPDSQKQLEADFFRRFWTIQNPIALVRKGVAYLTEGWADMSTALASLADGADLVLTGTTYQEVAANVAEYYDIPLAALHYFPARTNSRTILLPHLPSPLIRPTWIAGEWLNWRMRKEAEDAQRRELGLPKATCPSTRRMDTRGALEIQAYDELFFPGLAEEWGGRRPFVGALTMELATDADDEVASWIAKGTPPIYFGFGSMPVESPADTVLMIAAACAQVGERALVSCGDKTGIRDFDHVKVVGAVNHAAVFPTCRAVVHHGGAGTIAAGIRAGVPSLILWVGADQPMWAARVKWLKVGSARRFSSTTTESLVADLRRILASQYLIRARDVATRMTKPAASVTAAADLLEDAVRQRINS
jgi:UDP:flavonoid glycosyltransferase YjiC (YdhE family)